MKIDKMSYKTNLLYLEEYLKSKQIGYKIIKKQLRLYYNRNPEIHILIESRRVDIETIEMIMKIGNLKGIVYGIHTDYEPPIFSDLLNPETTIKEAKYGGFRQEKEGQIFILELDASRMTRDECFEFY